MVVEGGEWLSYRKVLLSFETLESIRDEDETVIVSVDGKSVEESPELKTELPVSREAELKLAKYWNWTPYWVDEPLPEYIAHNVEAEAPVEGKELSETRARKESHLRSVDEVKSYVAHAEDGECGHVKSIVADDSDWSIRYMLVDTRRWIPGKEVLIPVRLISGVSWSTRELNLETDCETIRTAPQFESLSSVDKKCEEDVNSHFGL
jgi:hypothetical protein